MSVDYLSKLQIAALERRLSVTASAKLVSDSYCPGAKLTLILGVAYDGFLHVQLRKVPGTIVCLIVQRLCFIKVYVDIAGTTAALFIQFMNSLLHEGYFCGIIYDHITTHLLRIMFI